MMMFKTVLFASVVTLLGSTLGRALPYQQMEARLAIRDISVVGVRSIPAQVPEIVVRGEHVKRVVLAERQIAEETPVKTENGQIVNYKRQNQVIPAEVAVKSDGGDVVVYDKRQIAAEQPTKSDGGAIVAYPKRQIAAEQPTKSDGGAIVAYPKRNDIPSELPTRSEGGVISLY